MSLTRLKHVAIALAVVIFLWGLAEVIRGDMEEVGDEFVFPQLPTDEVDRVDIDGPRDTVRLVKRDSAAWTVNGHRAAVAGVREFLAQLTDPSGRGELVARNVATHARMEVDTASARRVRIQAGDETLYELLVGKRGQHYQTFYVRRPGEDEVYMLRSGLVGFVDRDVDEWRDRKVSDVPPDSVHTVEITRARNGYAVSREDDGWRVGDHAADSASVARMLREFDNLAAAGFPTPEEEGAIDFTPPDRRAVVRDAAGGVLVDLAFDSTDAGFWVRRRGDDQIYRLDTFRVDRLTPTDSALRAPTN